jgi:hypothetical protein
MPLTLGQRKELANDTIARSASIVASTPGASSSSTFISLQDLAPLDTTQSPAFGETGVEIVNADAFTVARSIAAREGKADAEGKIAVLNLASDEYPGGGWLYSLSKTQVGRNLCSYLYVHDFTHLPTAHTYTLGLFLDVYYPSIMP